jgi:hypothetical protein
MAESLMLSGNPEVILRPILRTCESISVGLSPFAERKRRSFAERKATLVSASILSPRRKLARREFLVGCLRSAAVAGVTGVSAALVLRTTRLPAAECRRRTACRGCPEWAGCTLPPAVAARCVGATAGLPSSEGSRVGLQTGVAAPANKPLAPEPGRASQERAS